MHTPESNPTANAAALMRAAHLFVDDAPPILEDRIALSFIGEGYKAVFKEYADTFRPPHTDSHTCSNSHAWSLR